MISSPLKHDGQDDDSSPPIDCGGAIVDTWKLMAPHCGYRYVPTNKPQMCVAKKGGLVPCTIESCPIINGEKIYWPGR